jgi:hypothetical protein
VWSGLPPAEVAASLAVVTRRLPVLSARYRSTVLDGMRHSREADLNAIAASTKAALRPFQHVSGLPPTVDHNRIIDQFFDFAGAMLQFERHFAKALAGVWMQPVEAARPRGGGDTIPDWEARA